MAKGRSKIAATFCHYEFESIVASIHKSSVFSF